MYKKRLIWIAAVLSVFSLVAGIVHFGYAGCGCCSQGQKCCCVPDEGYYVSSYTCACGPPPACELQWRECQFLPI